MSTVNDTSGQAHPYWYEWFVGLIEVVRLLNPDEGIENVAFQVASIQGWDDVVVTHANGTRFYQVKHTRDENNLTFGSLVELSKKENAEVDDKGKSLLGSLFEGARSSGLIDPNNELILYTNREDGSRWSSRGNGDRRPPLLEFWDWLKTEIETKELTEITVPSVADEALDYSAAWAEWTACFEGSETEATRFLKQLTIRTKEDDREGIELRIRESLAKAFGITLPQAAPLFDALCRELRLWTTGHSGVTAEMLCHALTIEPVPEEYAPAPPPPSPFFPPRLPVAEQLQSDLLDENEAPVVFLTGEPGSGKTSAVSWLANRRSEDAFQGIVGIRFFCFEPIRPEQPFISPDASRVKPEELWFSLLTQLRRGLDGRLHELQVPLRNAFLTWIEARAHVLRLADILGRELGRKFVISIDGIDHAARASQVMPDQIAEFFASLPSPNEVHTKHIRLLVAGQPPEYYANEYPTWLTIQDDKVRRIDLPKLEQDDIRCLLAESKTIIGKERIDEAVRLIDESSQGNTLSVVFAVAEAELCNSLEQLRARLNERSLGDGLLTYYDSIWNHALRNASELSCSLSGVISLARTPITADQLSNILSAWEKPAPWWNQVLSDLGPVLTRQGDRYLIRHNDVRVFLASQFNRFGKEQRQSVASQLVDHFGTRCNDRLAAHLHLFPLLPLANRSVEAAHLFNVEWVLEGASLGLELSALHGEGALAVSELCNAKSWSLVVSVSCALDTLDRVSEFAEYYLDIEPWEKELPPFLPTEASVRPFAQWTQDDFHQLVWDAHELVDGGNYERARGLLSRWLGELGIEQVVRCIPDWSSEFGGRGRLDDEPHLSDSATSDFEVLGSLSAALRWHFWGDLSGDSAPVETAAFFSFEKGFVNRTTAASDVSSKDELFAQHEVVFIDNLELMIRNLATAESWNVIAELLHSLNDEREHFSQDFRLEASWYALRSGASPESPWVIDVDVLKQSMSETPMRLGEDMNLAPFIESAKAIGWTQPSWDTGDIADVVLEWFDFRHDESVVIPMKLLFRTAAVVGRLESHLTYSDQESAAVAFTPGYIRQLLAALWGDVINRADYRFKGRTESSALAERLTQISEELAGDLENAALEAALPFAKEFVLGKRMNAIWNVLRRHGRLDVLRDWISYYIHEEGSVWTWSPDSARGTVRDLVPLARSIGMDDVADYAETRASKLIVGYISHKEYSLGRVNDWFLDAARNDPTIWSAEGWKLWELCRICKEKDGDNRFEWEILKGISATAIRAGETTAWWRLVSTTLPKKCEVDWHWRISQQFVHGYIEALAQGLVPDDDDVLPIWSIALSLSYWFDNADTSSLLILRDALLLHVSSDRRSTIEESMQSVSPVVSKKWEEEDITPERSATRDSAPERPREEDAWWNEVDRFLQNKDTEEHRYVGYASGLMSIAHRRAQLHGNEELLDGLNIQLNMHSRWAFGGETLDALSIPELPDLELDSTDDVFVELATILLDTYSVEATVAALEGLHSYVAQNPKIIPRLLKQVSAEWPRRWLLSAAESWAVLHPNDLADAKATLDSVMQSGDLHCRLQAWVVLTRNAQALGVDPPVLPLPANPQVSISAVEEADMALLEIPPTIQGSARFANKFSSVHMLLEYCALFGFDFDRLKGLIAKELVSECEDAERNLRERGPHRRLDFTYVPAEAENAFGNVVSSILSSSWCGASEVAELSQAILPNEDAWIHRRRPIAIQSLDDWPAESSYGREEIDNATRRQQMLNATKFASVDDNWTVVAARTRDFSRKEDFDLHFWFEEAEDSLLISAPKVPTCPGGRSFIWWIGEPLDLNSRFVSGWFVGGHQRLSHCHFEIRPPLNWRNEFGWTPNPQNPLEWLDDGRVVAKYERVHGFLEHTSNAPKYRQPMIDRWVMAASAFSKVKEKHPYLRDRNTFEVHTFRE